MARKFLLPLMAVIIIVAMVIPGCGAVADTFALTMAVSPAASGTADDVTAASPYAAGTVVSIQAAAAMGYQFVNWTATAGTFGSAVMSTTTFTMPGEAATVTANFETSVREEGAWVDEIIITLEASEAASVIKMQEGTVHIYGHDSTDSDLFDIVAADPDLDYQMCLGGSRDFLFNVVGPIFGISGKLNPFSVAEIREGMQWMIDRDYIAVEVLGGMGLPLYTQFTPGAAEETRYADIVDAFKLYYAYSPATGEAQITTAMLALNCTLNIDDKWVYDYGSGDELVEINQVIRTDLAPYPPLGDYMADILELELGFTVNRLYLTSSEAWGSYLLEDLELGLWHLYGGGWGMPSVFRTEVHSFAQFNTHLVMAGYAPWDALEPLMADWPEMYDAIVALRYTDFATMEEREDLVEIALVEVGKFANSIWSIAITSFIPYRAEIDMVLDACGGVSMLFAQTLSFLDEFGDPVRGGTIHMELPSILVNPINPVSGSAMTYDIMVSRDTTGDRGFAPHPTTGLNMPQRFESAAVTIQTGLPVAVDPSSTWCTLDFEAEIVVPGEVWADWDAENQVWITGTERLVYDAEYELTAKRKSVVTYPEDIYELPMHDGSTLSLGDFVMAMIVEFDRGKPDSPIFDESEEAGVAAGLVNFKGVEIVHDGYGAEPLTIAVYSDVYGLDAEHSITTYFPAYGIYEEFAPWHTIAIGYLAEADNLLAFSASKADLLEVEWADYTKGPSLPILAAQLTAAADDSFIPYEPTLGAYIAEAEADERYANLAAWYAEKEHFWASCGPFYLEAVYPIGKIVHLKAFDDYPDESEKWMWLLD